MFAGELLSAFSSAVSRTAAELAVLVLKTSPLSVTVRFCLQSIIGNQDAADILPLREFLPMNLALTKVSDDALVRRIDSARQSVALYAPGVGFDVADALCRATVRLHGNVKVALDVSQRRNRNRERRSFSILS